MNDNRKHHDRIIGVLKDQVVLVLEDTFDHGNGFTGATGYSMEVLTKQEAEDRNTDDELREYWLDACQNGHCEKSLAEWCDEARDEAENQGLHFVLDDPSFWYEFSELLEALSAEDQNKVKQAMGVDENFLDWANFSCGRCIDKTLTKDDFALLLDPEALEIAIKAENGEF